MVCIVAGLTMPQLLHDCRKVALTQWSGQTDSAGLDVSTSLRWNREIVGARSWVNKINTSYLSGLIFKIPHPTYSTVRWSLSLDVFRLHISGWQHRLPKPRLITSSVIFSGVTTHLQSRDRRYAVFPQALLISLSVYHMNFIWFQAHNLISVSFFDSLLMFLFFGCFLCPKVKESSSFLW